MNQTQPGLRHFTPARNRAPVSNCPMPERDDDDEFTPCVGEAMRDVLAARAIATLADEDV